MEKWMDRINSPEDLTKLSLSQLEELCAEIRETIIKTVSRNGGHLASNLGVVELTVALHRVFHEKEDRIVWDVGHQSYTHKILTGRSKKLSSIRTKNGLSGYPSRQESPYDPFNVGHASTSISAAFGIASAKKLNHEPGHVVAVIGDGALTGGLAYEGLNNAGRFNKNFIVILNDNKMSISHNVGAMARYLANIRTRPGYLKIKGGVESILQKVPVVGPPMNRMMKKSKAAVKHYLYNNTLFEDMGFIYYGPFDGHNLSELMEVLDNAKKIDHPILLHVITSKGKGYAFAEKNPGVFHGVSHFDIGTGKTSVSNENFSNVFGSALCQMAVQDKKICAITAAMKSGTGLSEFSRRFPDRFFDTGIAEEHAITFSGGLAAEGMHPVCALYSTFLQRAYDQLIHDIAIQGVNVTIAVDRAGIVGEDGETHQGIFDVAFLNGIPNCTIYSPCYYEELHQALYTAIYQCKGLSVVRYPRGKQPFLPIDFTPSCNAFDLYGDEKAPNVLLTYGRLFAYACAAQQQLLKSNIPLQIVKLNRIKPIDAGLIDFIIEKKRIFFFEEGICAGGVGEHFSALLLAAGYQGLFYLKAVNGFVKHASMKESLRDLGLDDAGMLSLIKAGIQEQGDSCD